MPQNISNIKSKKYMFIVKLLLNMLICFQSIFFFLPGQKYLLNK